MRRISAVLPSVLLAGACLLACPAVSRADYTVVGQVRDCNGAGVPNAYVNVVIRANFASDCDATGNTLVRVIATDAFGNFTYVQPASGNGCPDWCWNVYVTTPPLAGEMASDIACCSGLNPTGGFFAGTICNNTTGTVGPVINIQYAGECTGGGDPGDPPRLPH